MKNLSIIALIFFAVYLEFCLWNKWQADKSYALGKNYDSVQQYVNAYPLLKTAVEIDPSELTFRDELSYNQAVLASAIFSQIESSSASAIATLSADQKKSIVIPQINVSVNELVAAAISNSDQVVDASPNSLPFWKNRTKTFYQLSTIDPKYIQTALEAISRAVVLAPTDAKVHYNLSLLLGKNGQITQAIKILEETIKLKPDYGEAKTSLNLYLEEIKKP